MIRYRKDNTTLSASRREHSFSATQTKNILLAGVEQRKALDTLSKENPLKQITEKPQQQRLEIKEHVAI